MLTAYLLEIMSSNVVALLTNLAATVLEFHQCLDPFHNRVAFVLLSEMLGGGGEYKQVMLRNLLLDRQAPYF
jgi:hypothetical protein